MWGSIKKNKSEPTPTLSLPKSSSINRLPSTENIPAENEEKINSSPTCKNKFFRGLTLGCLAVDIPYFWFLLGAILVALRSIAREFNGGGDFLEILFYIFGIYFSGAGTLCDVTALNPIESAKKMASGEEKAIVPSEGDQKCKNGTAAVFGGFNQIIANPTYFIASTANALPFVLLTPSLPIRWMIAAPMASLLTLYYNLLYWQPVNQHSRRFIFKLFSNESMIVDMFRSLLPSLEVLIQSLSTACYRGVSNAYTMIPLLVKLFNRDKEESGTLYFIATVFIATFYISLFSRTLNTHKAFFDDKILQLSKEQLKMTRLSRPGLMIDALMVLLRAVPLSTLLYRHGSSNPTQKIAISVTAGLLTALQGFYARYTKRLYQTALTKLEEEKLLTSEIYESEMGNEQLFNEIKDQQKTPRLKTTVTTINVSGRIGRSLGFLGFLAELNQLLIDHHFDLGFDFYDLLCLHQLWGNTTLENEASFLQEYLLENWAYYKTKISLEKHQSYLGWGSFWLTKTDYPREYLTQFFHTERSTTPLSQLA